MNPSLDSVTNDVLWQRGERDAAIRLEDMPAGQATLLWLKRNMPRTADKVLAEVRARCNA